MNGEDKNSLLSMAEGWLQIAAKCDHVAQRHKDKGERLQYLEQQAFSTARRACAEELKRKINETPL